MSASKVESAPASSSNLEARLSIPSHAVRLCRNGIEFYSESPIATWTEMNVDVQTPEGAQIRGTGVVVACEGTEGIGYSVHLAFMSLTPQSQASLSLLAYA